LPAAHDLGQWRGGIGERRVLFSFARARRQRGLRGGRDGKSSEGHFGKCGIFGELHQRDRGLLPRLTKVDGGSNIFKASC
jgi:hypothetical protein